jgi:hypothetical protein
VDRRGAKLEIGVQHGPRYASRIEIRCLVSTRGRDYSVVDRMMIRRTSILGANKMSRPIGTPVYGLVIVLALSLYSWPLQAGMQLDIVAKFHNADLEFDVVTVIDPEVEASRNKVALLGIATPSRSSFSFGLKEWLSLIDLWTKAVKAQSGSWKVVGSMVETETSDVSHLTVSAGPGVKFAISSRKKGTATYVLSRDDMAGFEKALHQVKDFLSR